MTRTTRLVLLVGAVGAAALAGLIVHDRDNRRVHSVRIEPATPDPERPTGEPEPLPQDGCRSDAADESIPRSTDAAQRTAVNEWMWKINAPKNTVDPVELRNALRAALESGEPRATHSALMFLCERARTDLPDRSEYRNFVLPYLDDDHPRFRALAVSALRACGPQASDRPLILRLARDADAQVRVAVAHHIGDFFARDCTDAEASHAALKLLADEESVVNATIAGLRHVKVSHDVEARLIELAEDARFRQRVVFESLSRLNPKSDQVVDALVRIVRADRGETRRAAAWGLRTGVPRASRPRVAEAMLGVLSEPAYDDAVTDCVDVVVAYGDVTHLDGLRSLATDVGQPEKKRSYIFSKLRLPTAGAGG